VLTLVAFAVSLGASRASFLLSRAVIQGILDEPAVGLDDSATLRAVIGTALFITASGALGLALGTLIRHTAGALTAAITVLYPPDDHPPAGRLGRQRFTVNAGVQITYAHPVEGQLGPWAGFGVYCAWIAITMIFAVVLFNRRDA
jgi:hypothetical protein